MQSKKITYLEQWWEAIKAQEPAVRLEVHDALAQYAFTGIAPTLTPLAAAVFAGIRSGIDAQVRHKQYISGVRAKAGASHKGNGRKVKAVKNGTIVPNSLSISTFGTNVTNGTNETIVPNLLTDSELQENQPILEQNGTNVAIVPNSLTIKDFGTNVAIVPTSPPTPPFINNNININHQSACADAYVRMREWLGDNEQTLQILIMRNGLAREAAPREEMLALLDPYIRLFIEPEATREDIAQGYRREVKAHFENWLRSYTQKMKENEQQQSTQTNRRSAGGAAPSTTPPDYFGV